MPPIRSLEIKIPFLAGQHSRVAGHLSRSAKSGPRRSMGRGPTPLPNAWCAAAYRPTWRKALGQSFAECSRRAQGGVSTSSKRCRTTDVGIPAGPTSGRRLERCGTPCGHVRHVLSSPRGNESSETPGRGKERSHVPGNPCRCASADVHALKNAAVDGLSSITESAGNLADRGPRRRYGLPLSCFPGYSPMIFTSTRLRRPPSNSP